MKQLLLFLLGISSVGYIASKAKYDTKTEQYAHDALDLIEEEYPEHEDEIKEIVEQRSKDYSESIADALVDLWFQNKSADKKDKKEVEKYVTDHQKEFVNDFWDLYGNQDTQ